MVQIYFFTILIVHVWKGWINLICENLKMFLAENLNNQISNFQIIFFFSCLEEIIFKSQFFKKLVYLSNTWQNIIFNNKKNMQFINNNNLNSS